MEAFIYYLISSYNLFYIPPNDICRPKRFKSISYNNYYPMKKNREAAPQSPADKYYYTFPDMRCRKLALTIISWAF